MQFTSASKRQIADSVQRIPIMKLKLRSFQKSECREHTEERRKQLETSKELIRLFDSDELPSLVFSDEKTFCIGQFFNEKNDRVRLKGRASDYPDELRVTRRQGANQIMVWAAITAHFRVTRFLANQIFLRMGRREIKINQQIHRENALEPGLVSQHKFVSKGWTMDIPKGLSTVAKSRRHAKLVEKKNVPVFISHAQ